MYVYIYIYIYISLALRERTAGTSVVPSPAYDTGRAANIPFQSILTKLSVGQLAEFIIRLVCVRYVKSQALWKAVISRPL
jgi:hypothetical protein